jgi:hypothetical protein
MRKDWTSVWLPEQWYCACTLHRLHYFLQVGAFLMSSPLKDQRRPLANGCRSFILATCAFLWVIWLQFFRHFAVALCSTANRRRILRNRSSKLTHGKKLVYGMPLLHSSTCWGCLRWFAQKRQAHSQEGEPDRSTIHFGSIFVTTHIYSSLSIVRNQSIFASKAVLNTMIGVLSCMNSL